MSEIICRRIDEQTPSEDGEVGERVLVGSGRKVCAGKAHRSTSGCGRSHPPSSCSTGTATTPSGSVSSAAAISPNWAINATHTQLPGFGTWPKTAASPC